MSSAPPASALRARARRGSSNRPARLTEAGDTRFGGTFTPRRRSGTVEGTELERSAPIAVPILEAIAAIKAAGAIARAADEAVKALRTGVFARNDDLKKKLEAQLQELRNSLHHAGQIATLAAEYAQAHQKVRALTELCNRANLFLRDNMDSLCEHDDPNYLSDWRVLEMIFDGIRDNQDVPRLAALDRANWYDDQDRAQIDMRLEDERRAYDQAADAVARKAARDLERHVKAMIDSLAQVNLMLENTLYAKMFDALKALDGHA